jgi:AraC family transcriptional regulator of arabinose operon
MDIPAENLHYLFMSLPNRSSQLTILHAGRYPRCNAVIDKFFEGYCTVQFMEAGRVRLSYDRASHLRDGAWLWFAMPGPRIRFSSADGRPWHHRYVAFRGPLMNSWLRQGLIHCEPVLCPPAERARLAFLMDEILEESEPDDQWKKVRLINSVENLLVDIERLRQPQRVLGRKAGLAAALRTGWEAQPGEPIDYELMARSRGLSLSTFRRRFLEETGLPVHRYLIRLKIERARHLLLQSDWTVEQIADRLGFTDVFYFTRCFKNALGLPPARYRRTRLAGLKG